MEKRIEEVRNIAKSEHLGGIILKNTENLVLVTGGYWPRNGLSLCFIPVKGEPVLIVPSAEREDVTACEGNFVIKTFDTTLLKAQDPIDGLRNIFCWIGQTYEIPCGIFGTEKHVPKTAPAMCGGETSGFEEAVLHLMKHHLNITQFVNVQAKLAGIRTCKTELEIAKIQKANCLGQVGLKRFKDLLDEGAELTEIELACEVEKTIAVGACREGVRYARAWAQVTSGLRTVEAWKPGLYTTNKKIEPGDLVMIELCTGADGYFSDLTLTHHFGPVTKEKQNLVNLVKASQVAALSQLGPGKRAEEAFLAAEKVCRDAGFGDYFLHGIGHGVGFIYHEGCPGIGPGSRNLFRPGMIHSVEPGVYVPGVGGVRFEVNVVETDLGYEVLGKQELWQDLGFYKER